MSRRRLPIDPEGIYHVDTRGSFGMPLFTTTGEHELYLELYQRYSAKFRWRTYAWALNWNHVHFLVHLAEGGLSEGTHQRCLRPHREGPCRAALRSSRSG